MIEEKEKFIKRISNCLGRESVPEQPSPLNIPHDVHHDFMKEAGLQELKQTFIKNAELSGTSIYQCALADLNKTIVKAVTDFSDGQVVIADHDFFSEHNSFEELRNHFDQLKIWDISLSRKQNIADSEQATVGIAKAELALAESGTVVLFCHLGSGRSVSLLPKYTVTVICEQDLRPRLTQAMTFLKGQIDTGLPSSINFISGASSTADIELVRVQGVHGPLATSCIIVS